MPINRLRELLNKIKFDPNLDCSLCFIEYRDFQSEKGVGRAPLIICGIESQNVAYGGAIIPFHRITRVSYGSLDIYPFIKNQPFRQQIYDTWENVSLNYLVFQNDNLPDILAFSTIRDIANLNISSLATLEIKMGELPEDIYLVTAWETVNDDHYLRINFELLIQGRQLIFCPERRPDLDQDNLRPPSISI